MNTRPFDRRRCLALGLLAAVAGGCTIHVEQPRIQVQNMEFTGIGQQGLSFRVTFVAYNANTFTLRLRDLNARLVLEGHDAGTAVTVLGAELPTGRWVPVQADVVVPWSGAPQYLLAAAGNPNVSYTLDGNVTVEHYLSIRAPFQTGGTVPRAFFLGGASNTINSMINSVMPGFGGVQLQ